MASSTANAWPGRTSSPSLTLIDPTVAASGAAMATDPSSVSKACVLCSGRPATSSAAWSSMNRVVGASGAAARIARTSGAVVATPVIWNSASARSSRAEASA